MIVITGASDGLGKELAKQFKAEGKTVVNLSRTENPSVQNIHLDLTDSSSVRAATEELLQQDETIEVLINCAGVLSLEPLNSIHPEEIARVFGVNVMGAMQLTSLLVDRIKRDEGDIVNVASTIGTRAYENQAAYGSSKWAMRGFSQNLQLELKGTKVRVISFCVGGFNSQIAEKAGAEPITEPDKWMDPADIALAMRQMLALPKKMEVSEVIINRK